MAVGGGGEGYSGYSVESGLNGCSYSSKQVTGRALLSWRMKRIMNKPYEMYMCKGFKGYTLNVDIFSLYIFMRNSHFLNICENMCTTKNTFMKA